MKKKIYAALACACLLGLVGTEGGAKLAYISLGRAAVQALAFLIGFIFFAYKAGAFRSGKGGRGGL